MSSKGHMATHREPHHDVWSQEIHWVLAAVLPVNMKKTPISSKDAWPVGNWLWQLFVQMSSALSRESLIGKGIWESKLIWNVAQSNLRQTMTEMTLSQFKKGLQYLSNLFISRKLSFSFPLIVLTNTSSLYYFS